MPIFGGCLCGAVRYQARQPLPGPYATYNCHGRICRKLCAGAFVVGEKFCEDTFRFTRGEPKFRKSSQVAKRGYRADRGSRQIYRPFNTDRIDGNGGSLDHPADFSPKYDSGVENQLQWLSINHDLSRMRAGDWGDQGHE